MLSAVRCDGYSITAVYPATPPCSIVPGGSVALPAAGGGVTLRATKPGSLDVVAAVEFREFISPFSHTPEPPYSAVSALRHTSSADYSSTSMKGPSSLCISYCYDSHNRTLSGIMCPGSERITAQLNNAAAEQAVLNSTVVSLGTSNGVFLQAFSADGNLVAQTRLYCLPADTTHAIACATTTPVTADESDRLAMEQLLRVLTSTKVEGIRSTMAALDCIEMKSANGRLVKQALQHLCTPFTSPIELSLVNSQPVYVYLSIDDSAPAIFAPGSITSLNKTSLKVSVIVSTHNDKSKPQQLLLSDSQRSQTTTETSQGRDERRAVPKILFTIGNGFLSNIRTDEYALQVLASVDGGVFYKLTSESECVPSGPDNFGTQVRKVILRAVDPSAANVPLHTLPPRAEVNVIVPKFNIAASGKSENHRQVPAIHYGLATRDADLLLSITSPPGSNIISWVDGIKGAPLGAKGLLRLDPQRPHEIRVELLDSDGTLKLEQQLSMPRFTLGQTRLFLESGNVLRCEPPPGVMAVVSVDGGPERLLTTPLQLDGETPHTSRVALYATEMPRGPASHSPNAAPTTTKILEHIIHTPTFLNAEEISQMTKELAEFDPNNSFSCHILIQKLLQRSLYSPNGYIRRLNAVLAEYYHGRAGLTGALEKEYLARVLAMLKEFAQAAGSLSKVHFRLTSAE